MDSQRWRAGGTGDHHPAELGVPHTLVEGEADATWVFIPWEGIQTERDGIDLNAFALDDYDVSHGYTPVLLAHPEGIDVDALYTNALFDRT
ncbi:hypothetical protein C2R22_04340 [Salinigranum rubrum]|uniref:SsuA/THI5-like domain-containing protein n=1 Tax=Salinigranum rubrum TaxID=755307 RepID=A0A2I8VGC0_9EURY|nr:ABC transporter substrate-binding protein [Salinigranum rubrum]AUV80983.1 hypothetical protein C2R22_04340 [Salinigranum rubrum]